MTPNHMATLIVPAILASFLLVTTALATGGPLLSKET